MLKKIKCSETGIIIGSSICTKSFEVISPEHLRLESKKHYLYDSPHTTEMSNNFLYKNKEQFDTDAKRWEDIFENDNIGEIIKKD